LLSSWCVLGGGVARLLIGELYDGNSGASLTVLAYTV